MNALQYLKDLLLLVSNQNTFSNWTQFVTQLEACTQDDYAGTAPLIVSGHNWQDSTDAD